MAVFFISIVTIYIFHRIFSSTTVIASFIIIIIYVNVSCNSMIIDAIAFVVNIFMDVPIILLIEIYFTE